MGLTTFIVKDDLRPLRTNRQHESAGCLSNTTGDSGCERTPRRAVRRDDETVAAARDVRLRYAGRV